MELSAAALQHQCPHCAQPIALRTPDFSEHFVCEHCNGLSQVVSDNIQPELKPLRVLKFSPTFSSPEVLSLGATGVLEGVDYVVVGRVQRVLQWCHETHTQNEYWLFNHRTGFRRLLYCEQHWSLAEKIKPQEVNNLNTLAHCRNIKFERFDNASSQDGIMAGEFGGLAGTSAKKVASLFISPPWLLICESYKGQAQRKNGTEREWWLARYLDRQTVEHAFGLADLTEPSNIAPNQPFPHRRVYRYWGVLSALILLVALASAVRNNDQRIWAQPITLSPVTGSEETKIVFSEPFDLAPRKNLQIIAHAPVSNSWLYLEGDLINETTGLVYSFVLPVEYYYGVEGGESWSEGSQTAETYLSALPAGRYTLRLEIQWERWASPFSVDVQLRQGVPRLWHFGLTLLALALIPMIVGLYQHSWYEPDRWKGSPFLPDRYKPKEDN